MACCCLPRKITLALFAYFLCWIVILLIFMMFLSFNLLSWNLHTPNSFPFIVSFLDVFMFSWITFRLYKLYRNETSNEKDCTFQFEGIDGFLFAFQIGLSLLFFFFFSPPLWDLPLFYYLLILHSGSLSFLILYLFYTCFQNLYDRCHSHLREDARDYTNVFQL